MPRLKGEAPPDAATFGPADRLDWSGGRFVSRASGALVWSQRPDWWPEGALLIERIERVVVDDTRGHCVQLAPSGLLLDALQDVAGMEFVVLGFPPPREPGEWNIFFHGAAGRTPKEALRNWYHGCARRRVGGDISGLLFFPC